jgi:valyl-tRNA synthetase
VDLHVETGDPEIRDTVDALAAQLQRLARAETLHWGPAGGALGASAVLKSGLGVFLPLEGVVDLDRERARLREEVSRVESLLAGARRKLANENFVDRAPEEVVDKERDKARSLEAQLEGLREKLALFQGGE